MLFYLTQTSNLKINSFKRTDFSTNEMGMNQLFTLSNDSFINV